MALQIPNYESTIGAPAPGLPSTVVRNENAFSSPLVAEVNDGLQRLNQRMWDMKNFIFVASASRCSCTYGRNSGCMKCLADETMARIVQEDAPQPQAPAGF